MDKVSLQDLIDEHGMGWVRERAEVRFPESRETFISRLYGVVDQLVKVLESDANLYQGDGEEKISKILCRMLEQRGYGATAETDHRCLSSAGDADSPSLNFATRRRSRRRVGAGR